MIWAAPAGFFALLALLTGLAPAPPGLWLDRFLHLFGIGSVSARQTALSMWVVAAIVSGGAGFAIAELTNASSLVIVFDGAAIGVTVALFLLWLASRRNTRGTGLMD